MSQDNQANNEGTSFKTLFIGGLLFLLFVSIIITLTYLAIYNKNQDAIAENDGFGSEDKPIAAQQTIKMDEFDVKLTHFSADANTSIMAMHENNPMAEDGSVYMLVEAELMCEKIKCNGGEVVIDLIDKDDELWEALESIFLEPNLAEIEAEKGDTIRGWVAFLVPIEAKIEYAKVWKAGGPILFAELPAK